ncbi:DUF4232 domain-containing protein [Streptomyces lancefieldiae]|uniref:DUF4232 domain-containing protein n=1 Tax=Streptomyces lancefieldiae TaxID=3075520 RepID=A0ABU3AZD6_9ACTN|nr:DUF4232 domain-containing protein [Streptomyces sp. DSM 40712]MDT0615288.1 DUF4232 domain-containing protein [Streptomyces sp. DSM 40712]
MSARTTRTRLFAATTVALAALALTACEGDDGTDTGAAAPSSTSSTPASSAPTGGQAKPSTGGGEADGGKGADAANGSTGSDKSGAGSSGAGSSGAGSSGSGSSGSGSNAGDQDDPEMPGKCSASDVKITATKVSRPINHLLLTATSTGSKTCMLPPYPVARFGEAQSVPPVIEESQPHSVAGVGPGETAYAGVLLTAADGSGGEPISVNTLRIPFDDDSIANVALPSGVVVDSKLSVTYWQTSIDNALEH